MNQNSKIQELQFLEQNLNVVIMQKQTVELEISETESALKEIEKSKGEVYKLLGNLMIKCDRIESKKEMENRLKNLKKRQEIFETQEDSISKRIEILR